MKLVIAIVHNRDKGKVMEDLIHEGFKFTVIGSTGGFLREGSTTLLIGVPESDVANVLKIVRHRCMSREQLVNVMPLEAAPAGAFLGDPVKVPVGGGVAFVLDIDQFERF